MQIELELGQTQKQLEKILPKWEPKHLVGKTQEELESIFANWDPQQIAKNQATIDRLYTCRSVQIGFRVQVI